MNLPDISSLDILVTTLASGAAYRGIKPIANQTTARSIAKGLYWINQRAAPYLGDLPWYSLPLSISSLTTLLTWWW